MHAPSRIRRSLLVLALAIGPGLAAAQTQQPAASTFKPSVGQGGKDVIWVPTPQALVDKMLDMAAVTPADHLIDLGSGDGRTVITAAKRGVRALGIEYDARMVEFSQRNARNEGVSDRATFVRADIFESDFSKATVITMFLLEDLNLRLRPKLLDLKPGTRLVSNTFTMGEWQADQTVNATDKEGCQSYCNAHLWIVPAKVAGTWKLPQGELTLTQQFQMLQGQLKTGDRTTPISDGRMQGSRMTFKADGVEYSGRVDGNRVEGTGGGTGAWTATRTAAAAMGPGRRDSSTVGNETAR